MIYTKVAVVEKKHISLRSEDKSDNCLLKGMIVSVDLVAYAQKLALFELDKGISKSFREITKPCFSRAAIRVYNSNFLELPVAVSQATCFFNSSVTVVVVATVGDTEEPTGDSVKECSLLVGAMLSPSHASVEYTPAH